MDFLYIWKIYMREFWTYFDNLGATVNIGIHPSKVVVNKLKLDRDRKQILDRKKRAADKDKGKIKAADTQATPMAVVD